MNSLGIVTALKKILPIFKRSFKEKSYVLCYSIFPKWQVVFFISVILLSFSIRFMSVLKNLAGIFSHKLYISLLFSWSNSNNCRTFKVFHFEVTDKKVQSSFVKLFPNIRSQGSQLHRMIIIKLYVLC